jgi:hypothetical protein
MRGRLRAALEHKGAVEGRQKVVLLRVRYWGHQKKEGERCW